MFKAQLRQCLVLFCVTAAAVFAHAEPNAQFLKTVLSKKNGISVDAFLRAEAKMKAELADDINNPEYCSIHLTDYFKPHYGKVDVYIEHLPGPRKADLKHTRIEVQIENIGGTQPYAQAAIRAYIPVQTALAGDAIGEKIEFDIISRIPKGLSPIEKAEQFDLAEARILEIQADLEKFMAKKWKFGAIPAFTMSSSSIRGPYWRARTLTLTPMLAYPEVVLSIVKYLGSR